MAGFCLGEGGVLKPADIDFLDRRIRVEGSATTRGEQVSEKKLPTPLFCPPYFFLRTGLFFLRSGRCVRTDAATLLTRADVFGLRRSALAIFPTRFDVFSFFANGHLLV